MNTKVPQLESISPAVHLEFIQNQLQNVSSSAEQEIEQYHRALFLHQHAVHWERYRQEAKTHQERLNFLEARLKDAEVQVSTRRKLVAAALDGKDDLAPTPPWNFWDVTMFVVCSLAIVCLITFGVLNISFNLLESGLVTFRESPLRSYLWAALLPVGALAVKIGWDFLKDEKQREQYLWTCLALGLVGVIVWVGAYASVYPTLSKGISEHIASLSVFDNSNSAAGTASALNFAGAKWVDIITVAAQAVAEIFLSAVLGMYLTNLYARHRPVRLAVDPAFVQLNQERVALENDIARERIGLGEATGNLVRLENQLQALIAYGKSLFHRENARKQDESEKREVILSQLSDHLRHHLNTIESGSSARFANALANAGAERKNGD